MTSTNQVTWPTESYAIAVPTCLLLLIQYW